MAIEKIEKIKKIAKGAKAANVTIEPELKRVAPNKEKFDELMVAERTKTQKTEQITAQNAEMAKKPSLMDEMRDLNSKVDKITKVSPTELAQQSDKVIAQIEELKDKLSNPNLDLKTSTQTILNNKLNHIDESLRIALTKAGLEYTPPEKATIQAVNPMERFLGFLTHGQEQLQSLSKEVELMHLNKKEITPANMLRIQIKVGYIQNEIEFFTNALNQALQSTKTIMNVQV